jgi:5'-nucleotidase
LRRTRSSLAAAAVVASAALLGLPTAASAAPAPTAAAAPADIPVQLLTMNDFHGRISETTGGDSQLTDEAGNTLVVGGAAHISSTVQSARAAFVAEGGAPEASLFVGAGDLISASPFNSSVFKDEPTIEVLDAMGLDVSSVGNHEFDRGTDELKRISAATDPYELSEGELIEACEGVTPGVDGCFTDSTGHPFDGADFPYLAANVVSKDTGNPLLPPFQLFDVGGGKQMALIGVVTETTPTIVSPAGIDDVEFIDEAQAINTWVPVLQEAGVEAIGVLIHEGGENTGLDEVDPSGCDALTGPIVDINAAVDPAVDVIVSAHSHQAYDCVLTDPAGQPRLVTQAGFYGRLLGDIRLTIDGTTGDVERICAPYSAHNVPVTRDTTDPDVAAVVEYWDAQSRVEGNEVVGSVTEDIRRAGSIGTDPATGQPVFIPVRDGESSLGNLVAEMQLEAVQDPAFGAPVIAFMNPGGLRTDLTYAPGSAGEAPGETTYAELFGVQPFGNTVDVITLTGADVRGVLEQQFQVGGPRNSTLRLGTSEGFAYSYDLSQPYGRRVDPTTITLDGQVIDPAGSYRVAANSFLVTGGDTFTAFTNGTDPATGPVDVDTAVSYFRANSPVSPPAADHGTATTFATAPAPAEGLEGNEVEVPPVGTADAVTAKNGVAAAGFECPPPVDEEPPAEQPGPPVEVPEPPVDQPAPPVQQPAPPVHQPAPPVQQPAPPVVQPVVNPRPVASSGDELAYTGAPIGQMLGFGGALLAGGVALTTAGYRRRRGLAD